MIGWSRSAPALRDAAGGEAARRLCRRPAWTPHVQSPVSDSAVSPRQRRKIIAFEQRQERPRPRNGWEHVVLAQDEAGRDIMLAVAKRRLVENLGVRIRENGLYPKRCCPPGWCCATADRLPVRRASRALVLSVGAARPARLRRSERFSACTLAVGGNTVTQKVAENWSWILPPPRRSNSGGSPTRRNGVGARERVRRAESDRSIRPPVVR